MRFEEFNRYGILFGILMMDIDHFKQINDHYGHIIGDMVLQMVANTFTNNSQPFDLYGQWGGEEFIGVNHTISKSELVLMGNRSRLLIENSYLMHEQERISTTISIGATIIREDDSPDKMIKRSDELLFASKNTGRNRLTIG